MSTTMTWNLEVAIAHLNQAAGTQSKHQCAKYTMDAINSGGLLVHRTAAAKNFGPFLEAAGFKPVAAINPLGPFQRGDVVVIQSYTGGNPNGHMAMFNGKEWVSDFHQGLAHGSSVYSVGPGYRKFKPSFKVYRYQESAPSTGQ